MRHIALLRGINLGARRRVPMARLRAVLADAGHGDVRTLLQSGNVVLESRLEPDTLARRLAQEIEQAFGFEVGVVVRTREELAGVVARDPFEGVADDPRRYQVTFLSAKPAAKVVKEIERADFSPEQVRFSGREIYAWHPDGLQRSKLARMLESGRLGVTATARNWNTVRKLLEMAAE